MKGSRRWRLTVIPAMTFGIHHPGTDFVHHHIESWSGLHIHLYRARGIKGAMKYEWSPHL